MYRPKFLMSQLHVSGGSSNVKKTICISNEPKQQSVTLLHALNKDAMKLFSWLLNEPVIVLP